MHQDCTPYAETSPYPPAKARPTASNRDGGGTGFMSSAGRHRWTTLLLAALAGGCVHTPPTKPQLAPIEATTLGLDGAPAPAIAVAWWQAFKDPQLDRLVAGLVDRNPGLEGALARMRAAQAELAFTGSEGRPQLSLDAEEQRMRLSGEYIIPPPYGGSHRWTGEVVANLSWNLDFWGRQADLIARSRHGAEAAALDVEAARQALAGALVQTYLQLALAWQSADIAAADVEDRTTVLGLVESRFDHGLENAAAAERAKALLAEAKAGQARVVATRDTLVHAVAALAGLGADAHAGIHRPGLQPDAALPLPSALPADLLARRPDILAARARIDAALAGREAARAVFYPDINLVGLVGFQAIGLSNLFDSEALTYGAGPAIHLPLFDAGRLRAQYAGMTAGLDMAVADYNEAVLSAVRQTADALTRIQALADQRTQQGAALAAAERAHALVKSRQSSGLASRIDVLAAASTVLAARERADTLAAQSAIQRVALLVCVGGGFH